MYKYFKKICSIIIVLTVFSTISEGQVTVRHRKITVPSAGGFVYDSLKVADFDSLLSIQFAYYWDSKILNFVDIIGLAPLGLKKDTHFNLLNTSNGSLRFLWESNSILGGTNLVDSTPIFIVKFQVIGKSGEYSYLYIDEQKPDFYMEFVQDSSRVAIARDPRVAKGYVCIGSCMITSSSEQPLASVQLFPNPVSNNITLDISQHQASDWTMKVYSLEGVLRKEVKIGENNSSDQRLTIGMEDIPPGVYQVVLSDYKNMFSKLIIKE